MSQRLPHETRYCIILDRVEDHGMCIERIYVKAIKQEEIRFGWRKDGRLIMRPPDTSREHWLQLIKKAIQRGILTPEFAR